MNDITVGQIVVAIGAITALWVFADKILKKIDDIFDRKLKPIKEDITTLKKDITMLSDVSYQMLDHMATNNNTGGMKAVLDKYNEYNRHN
jgi:gas vesicle protein